MVDIDIDALNKTISEIEKAVDSLGDNFTNLVQKLASSGGDIDQWSDKINRGTKSAADSFGRLSGVGNILKEPLQFLNKLQDSLYKVTSASDDGAKSIINIGVAVMGASRTIRHLFPLSEAFKSVGSSAKDAGMDIQDSLQQLGKHLGFDRLPAAIEFFASGAENARKFETGLLAVEAKAGSLDDRLSEMGGNLNSLDKYTDAFSKRLQHLADASGMSTKEIVPYVMELKKFHGALDQAVNIGDAAGGTVDLLTAAIKVSRGTIQDINAVLSVYEDRWEKFSGESGSGQKALEIMSLMYKESQELHIPFQRMNDAIKTITDQFQYFGDNAAAAIKLVDGLGRSLTETGLGPKAMIAMLEQITGRISELDTAQKAFLSAQTGGPGGLRGAYDIQLKIQRGEIDKVYKLVEQSLRQQFGGRIVGLEEAAKDQGAAAQLTKQIAFLRQGPYGQLAGSEAQAIKLLEAFKKGTDPRVVRQGEKELQSVAERGQELQKRQETIFNHILNTLERQAQILEQIQYSIVRSTAGRGGPEAIRRWMEDAEKFARHKSQAGMEQGSSTPQKALIKEYEEFKKAVGSSIQKETTKDVSAGRRRIEELNKLQAPPNVQLQLPPMADVAAQNAGKLALESATTISKPRSSAITPNEANILMKGTTPGAKTPEATININVNGEQYAKLIVEKAAEKAVITTQNIKNANNQGLPAILPFIKIG